jgi:hypothetical protein
MMKKKVQSELTLRSPLILSRSLEKIALEETRRNAKKRVKALSLVFVLSRDFLETFPFAEESIYS